MYESLMFCIYASFVLTTTFAPLFTMVALVVGGAYYKPENEE